MARLAFRVFARIIRGRSIPFRLLSLPVSREEADRGGVNFETMRLETT